MKYIEANNQKKPKQRSDAFFALAITMPGINSRYLILAILLLVCLLGCYKWWKKKSVHRAADYSLLSYFPDTILFQYDCKSNLLSFTPNVSNRFHSQEQAELQILNPEKQLEMIHPDDVQLFQRLLKEMKEAPARQMQSLNLRLMDKNGAYCWMLCQIQALPDEQGRPCTIVGKLSDIQEQRRKEQQLIKKASIDSITGILNRKAVDNQIIKRLASTEKGFLFMIDIDNFKALNDTLGHSAGDDALIRFASEIQRNFRQGDLIGRIGGDEFIVLMSDTDQEAVACSKAEQLLSRLANWQKTTLSASIGIASYPRDGCTYGELFEAADAAMYQVKQQGKNGYHLSEKKRL